MTALPLPAAGGPYTGPQTGDFDVRLEALPAIAERLEGSPGALAAFRAAVTEARVTCR
jgi:hypothetical protein